MKQQRSTKPAPLAIVRTQTAVATNRDEYTARLLKAAQKEAPAFLTSAALSAVVAIDGNKQLMAIDRILRAAGNRSDETFAALAMIDDDAARKAGFINENACDAALTAAMDYQYAGYFLGLLVGTALGNLDGGTKSA